MITARSLDDTATAMTAPESEPSLLQVASTVLGDIDVSPTLVMHFPVPLGGFPTHQDYVLVPAAREGLWWLQSITDPDLTFILGDPFLLDASYAFDLGDVESQTLGIVNPTDAFGLVMITLPVGSTDRATANCRAPIVFNLKKQVGMQVVSRDDAHEVRRPVDLTLYKPQASGLRMQ